MAHTCFNKFFVIVFQARIHDHIKKLYWLCYFVLCTKLFDHSKNTSILLLNLELLWVIRRLSLITAHLDETFFFHQHLRFRKE